MTTTTTWAAQLRSHGRSTATPTVDPQPRGTQVRFSGLLPSEDQQSVLEIGKLLESYLEKQLPGLDVKLFVGPAYAATIEAMARNELEFAFFGPRSRTSSPGSAAQGSRRPSIQDFRKDTAELLQRHLCGVIAASPA
ncbi:MAG: PhnD/SsuA/transferrin family substrate-binding protein [Dehalococcoidia bacterium]|uniref:PhnD/SsuA/transferrin family substrate-binding protein n=1 Tax=Candidatus Amarobacter glycogenicus TaxID=3140699 RepID=UPI003136F7B8|nr:PhnD/SsuA/transferrin family substrate-binding protein [Dehalococcoidia bacterium]